MWEEPTSPWRLRQGGRSLPFRKKKDMVKRAGRADGSGFYMSPMRRCLETAELLFRRLITQAFLGTRSRIFGNAILAGLNTKPGRNWKPIRTISAFWIPLEKADSRKGETTQAFKERVIRAFIGILQENFKEAYEQPDSIEPGNRGQAENT